VDRWRINTPWIQAYQLRRLLEFTQPDALTWMTWISPQECVSLLDRLPAPHELAKSSVDPLQSRLADASTREVKIYLAEW
jgi:hypothetical protein